jgi:hypothetical protein
MLIHRPLALIQQGLDGIQVLGVRVQPGFDRGLWQRDDAAVVAGRGHLRRRLEQRSHDSRIKVPKAMVGQARDLLGVGLPILLTE